MFTGLNEIHFPALPLAEPNVNTEDINGKQTMESVSWGAVTLPPTHVSSRCVLLHTHTHRFIQWWHAITIHSLFLSHTHILGWVGRCPDTIWPQWALEVNYCLQMETWPDNLSAAGSGLSKTTVSFSAHTHTAYLHAAFVWPSLSSVHSYCICWLFAFHSNSLSVCAFASPFSSFSTTCSSPLYFSSLTLFPTTLAFIPQNIHLSVAALASACNKFQG